MFKLGQQHSLQCLGGLIARDYWRSNLTAQRQASTIVEAAAIAACRECQGPECAQHGMQKIIDKDNWDAPIEFMPPERDVPTPANE